MPTLVDKPDASATGYLLQVLCHPWFLKKLPPHATEMNDYYLSLPLPTDYQQPEEIKALLAQVRRGRRTLHSQEHRVVEGVGSIVLARAGQARPGECVYDCVLLLSLAGAAGACRPRRGSHGRKAVICNKWPLATQWW